MDITTKLGYREQLPSQMTADQLIYTFTHMVTALQEEADRIGVYVNWAAVRIETEVGETYSFMDGPLHRMTIQVYGENKA